MREHEAISLPMLSNQEKIDAIAEKFSGIMEILGLDLSDESLRHTPQRVAKMYVEDVFSGLDPKTFPKISLFEDSSEWKSQSN
ncbi:MAG: GTP cyclohydrolase I, partial [Parachlamydiaceae bacterium]